MVAWREHPAPNMLRRNLDISGDGGLPFLSWFLLLASGVPAVCLPTESPEALIWGAQPLPLTTEAL